MKSFKRYLKLLALILCSFLFVQNCTVYKSASVSIYEAAKSQSKVKIIKNNGKSEKFSKVELFDNGQFYGKKKTGVRGEYIDVRIDTSTVQKVRLHDKKNSTIQSIALPVVIIGVIFAVREHVRNNLSVGW